jgi:hypothetical protein
MRKQCLFNLWIVLIITLSSCSAVKNGAQLFTSDTGRFSIMTLQPFKESSEQMDVSGITLVYHMFTAEQSTRTDIVAYTDYPEEIVSKSDPVKLLDGASDGAVKNISGSLVSKAEVSLDGNPGREIVATATAANGQEYTLNGRIYLVKNRLYMVMIVSNIGELTKDQTDAFLESFKLLQ